ncbi:MAG: hypothetical protein JNG90_14730 [Planctomycetaceae bacterium]|nr:hypothetical protein [Planctomycetaceae bacterium]
MARGSQAAYQLISRNMARPESESVKFQKEAVEEAKKTNRLLNDNNTLLREAGVDRVEIA